MVFASEDHHCAFPVQRTGTFSTFSFLQRPLNWPGAAVTRRGCCTRRLLVTPTTPSSLWCRGAGPSQPITRGHFLSVASELPWQQAKDFHLSPFNALSSLRLATCSDKMQILTLKTTFLRYLSVTLGIITPRLKKSGGLVTAWRALV